MKPIRLLLLLSAVFIISAKAGAETPKHEMRAGWIYTVWNLDWPSSAINVDASADAQARQRAQQQQRLVYHLDKLQSANINTVFFQVRSCADAMYRSAYEPWSGWLVSSRGADPGWDPLEFIIREAHKRGMALHAWIDPYRYETTAGMWNGTLDPGYSVTNPEWIYTYDNFNILNPGLPEVRQRVVDVVNDIIDHYDVDGIALNDYFYVNNGGKTDDRQVDYDLYLQMRESESQSQDDWRRENVTRMVGDVYDACMAKKPYLLVGVSPSGEMCTSEDMADRYGVEVSPCGWDWQYSYIFSEPLEWLSRGKVDYLFPQIYWTIGYEIEDFAKLCPWWQKTLNRFGRHNYVKHSLNGMTNVPKTGQTLPKATGPNSSEASEYINEILLTRATDWNRAPGQGFFKTSDITTTPRFVDYLVENAYSAKAIPPAAGWKPYAAKGIVENIHLDGDTLRWDCADADVRFAVYAVPFYPLPANQNVDDQGLLNARETIADSSRLLGVAYENKMYIAEKKDSEGNDFEYYVSILDRYWVEHSPASMQFGKKNGFEPPEPLFPADGATASLPFNFSWSDDGSSVYRFEVAEDAAFEHPIWSVPVADSKFPAVRLLMLKPSTTYYWRVVAFSVGNAEKVSSVRSFVIDSEVARITYPPDGATDIPTTPTVEWAGADVASSCRLQIAVNNAFGAAHTVADILVEGASATIPEGVLNSGRTYYARVVFDVDGVELISPVNSFTTANVVVSTPQFVLPHDGDIIETENIPFAMTPSDGAAVYRVEVATSPSFPVRATKALSFDAPEGEITPSKGGLKVNTQYYLRPSIRYYIDGQLLTTAAGEALSVTYMGQNSVDGVVNDTPNAEVTGYYNMLGVRFDSPQPGVNIVRYSDGTARRVLVK